jgi:hypothetical protein
MWLYRRSEEHVASIIRITRVAVAVYLHSVLRSLVPTNVAPKRRFLKEPHCLTSQDAVLHSHRREHLKSYKRNYECTKLLVITFSFS